MYIAIYISIETIWKFEQNFFSPKLYLFTLIYLLENPVCLKEHRVPLYLESKRGNARNIYYPRKRKSLRRT